MTREYARPFESSLVDRLPELIAAPLEEPVYWTEGEKDVEALRAHGLLAVTTSDGPVPYDPRKVVRWLKGRKVVLVPDNDEAGDLYAAKIEESLLGIAGNVTRLEVPKGFKDVSDWLASGGKITDLMLGH
jgi:DNA primase